MNSNEDIFKFLEDPNNDLQELLSQAEIDLNIKNKLGESLLSYSVQKGNLQAATLLIKLGADIQSLDIFNYSPLRHAINKNDFNMVKLLVDSGADVNEVKKRCSYIIEFAVEKGNIEIVKYLLTQGADIDQRSLTGESILMIAIEKKQNHIAEYLINNGADLNVASNIGSALFRAINPINWDLTELLLSSGANINFKSKHLLYFSGEQSAAWYTLSMAINYNDTSKYEIFKYLIKKGANIDEKDSTGKNYLMWAAQEGVLEIVLFVVQQGIDIFAQDNQSKNALHYLEYTTVAERVKHNLDDEIIYENYDYIKRDYNGPEYEKDLKQRLGELDFRQKDYKIEIQKYLQQYGLSV